MKIAIIDDDYFARKNIIEQIKWEQLSCKDLKEYSNGIDFLEDIDKELFDIIITDIKMPDMDGIEIAKSVQKKYPDVKIIFISAYPEKEYLKSAIKLKAVDFIEKPININDLQNTLLTLYSIIKMQKNWISYNNIITDQFTCLEKMGQLCDLLLHNKITDDSFCTVADYFHFHESDYSHCVCLSFKLSNLTNQINVFGKMEISLLTTVIKKLQGDNIFQIFMHKADYLVVIVFGAFHSQSVWQEKITSICNIYLTFLNGLGLKVVCGIGEPVTSLNKLPLSYQQAMISLQQAYYTERVLNYYIAPSLPAFNKKDFYLEKYKKLLILQKKDKVFHLLEELKNTIAANCNTLISETVNIYYELLEFLWNQTQEMQLCVFTSIKSKTELISKLNSFFIFKYLYTYAQMVNEEYFMQIHKNDYGNLFVNKMANYIDLNYSNFDLQILSISNEICLAPNYANHIFKKYTNMTLNQYIQKTRMQIAKRLLENTDDTLDHIASKIGITGNAYFTKVFQKQFGMSPNEYRKEYYENKK